MITVKISDIVNSTEILQKLAQQNFKAKLALSIARLLKKAEEEIQTFNSTRIDLIKKYGTKGEDGELVTDEEGNCKIAPDSIETFNKELTELLNTEIEINANKIDVNMLDDCDFTPSEIAALEPFLEE